MNFYKVRYLFDPRDVFRYKSDAGKDLMTALWEEIGCKVPADRLIRYETKFNEISVIVCNDGSITEKDIDQISSEISKALNAGELVTKVEPVTPEKIMNGPAISAEDKAFLSGFAQNGAEPKEAPVKKETTFAEEKAGRGVGDEDVFGAVEALIGMEALKKWANEMKGFATAQVASPHFSKTVLSMSYLVSVNGGNGCTTICEKMGKVVANILGKETIDVREIMVEPDPNAEKLYNVKRILADIAHASSSGNKLYVFALGIEKFQNNVHIQEWIRLLSAIRDKANALVIFTLPYLEKRVVYDMHQRIEDILPNRMLTVKPYNNEEYAKFFALHFKNAGMTVSPEAMELFPRLLAKERSDGRFYGIDTINKICDEILFEKLKSGRKENETTVTAEDAGVLLREEKKEQDGLSGMEKLDALTSLGEVKRRIKEMVASVKGQRKMNMPTKGSMHMMFGGAPGTGKTVVARLLGQILREEKILSAGGFFEVSRKDLVGSYVGHTAPKTAEICQLARGSVLFIDEAYALDGGSEQDFGKEAISTLIAEMENYRDDFVVIFAGYEKQLEQLFDLNPGLRDRIPYRISFASYSREELEEIFFSMLPSGFTYDESFEAAAKKFFASLPDDVLKSPNFSNARYVRNLTERVLSKAYLRIEMSTDQGNTARFTAADFELATADAEFGTAGDKKKYRGPIGF